MINGVLVSKPTKKIEYLSDSEPSEPQTQQQVKVWKLTPDGAVLEQQEQESEVASTAVPVNKLREIHNFIKF